MAAGHGLWFELPVHSTIKYMNCMFVCYSLEYELMFGVDSLKQAKAERLMYGESVMTHAMVLTGVNLVVCKTKLNFVYLTMIAKQFITNYRSHSHWHQYLCLCGREQLQFQEVANLSNLVTISHADAWYLIWITAVKSYCITTVLVYVFLD